MLSTARRRCVQSTPPYSFLIQAFEPCTPVRSFSGSSLRQSHIGRAPVPLPPEVSLRLLDPPQKTKNGGGRTAVGSTVEVGGPLGKMSMQLPPFITIDHDEVARRVIVRVQDAEVRHQREMWGTTRAYLQNHVFGVSEGHTAILRLVGVGYRATIEKTATTVESEYPGQEFVSLKVGYSHPIELGIPPGVKASTPQPTRILLEGCEKEVVMQFAAKIRAWRVPEPYKGKGIFVNGETVKLKSKKIK